MNMVCRTIELEDEGLGRPPTRLEVWFDRDGGALARVCLIEDKRNLRCLMIVRRRDVMREPDDRWAYTEANKDEAVVVVGHRIIPIRWLYRLGEIPTPLGSALQQLADETQRRLKGDGEQA